jgi:hypothetical protein
MDEVKSVIELFMALIKDLIIDGVGILEVIEELLKAILELVNVKSDKFIKMVKEFKLDEKMRQT